MAGKNYRNWFHFFIVPGMNAGASENDPRLGKVFDIQSVLTSPAIYGGEK